MINSKQKISSLLLRLWNHIEAKRKMQFWFLLIITILASFAEVISIGAVLPFIGALTNPEKVFNNKLVASLLPLFKISHPKQLLLPLTILFCIAIILSGIMRMLLLWAQTKLSHGIGTDISLSVYKKTLYQPYSVHVSRNSSEVITGISNKAHGIIYSALLPFLTIISSLIMLIMILVALLYINSTVALFSVFGFGIIYVIIIQITKKRLKNDSINISRESNKVIKALQEGLGGIRDVLIDGTQSTYCKIYRDADLPLRKAQANIVLISGFPRFAIEGLGMILIAILAFRLSIKVEGLSMTIPILGSLALGAQRMMPMLQQAYASWTNIKGAEDSISDTLSLLDQPLPDFVDSEAIDIIPYNNNIVIQNLSFKYSENNESLILNGININITKGSRVGFMGVTGSGKSTLLDLLMGLLSATSGTIEIDGLPINSKNCRSWQAHIAHVPQSIFLSDSTILENIAFGIPFNLIDQEKVKVVAKMAQISETIELLENKYFTRVGERGICLSGGQRQRIGIARALYKDADVIIFDEATSALDNETENVVMQAIESLGDNLTIIIVAHRLTTLKNCDKIYELFEGRIKREGDYAMIVPKNNLQVQ